MVVEPEDFGLSASRLSLLGDAYGVKLSPGLYFCHSGVLKA